MVELQCIEKFAVHTSALPEPCLVFGVFISLLSRFQKEQKISDQIQVGKCLRTIVKALHNFGKIIKLVVENGSLNELIEFFRETALLKICIYF